MKIAVTGSSGLVGTALIPSLTTRGHNIVRLVRGTTAPGSGDVAWNPPSGKIDAGGLEGLDAVVHLAGENIAGRRWNAEQKAHILNSRVQGTKLLSETLVKLARPPRATYRRFGNRFLRRSGAPRAHRNSPIRQRLSARSLSKLGNSDRGCRPSRDSRRPLAFRRFTQLPRRRVSQDAHSLQVGARRPNRHWAAVVELACSR